MNRAIKENINESLQELFTINELTELLGVSRAKIYLFIKDEKNPLPVFYLSERMPRIKKTDLEKWLDKQIELNTI